MFKIFPEIEFSAQCPIDDSDLDIVDVAIPGMRSLADTVCPTCGSRYYVDLPVSHALWAPIVINQSTADIYDPLNIQWFSKPLKEGFLNPVEAKIVPVVHKFFDADRIIIVNCLDFLYGHSLLKLLNVQRYLEQSSELGCCVLVPTQLMHLVPDGVAEIWEFPVPIKDDWKWYASLERWIKEELAKGKECFLSPAYSHPSNRDYDLHRFVRNLPDISKELKQHEPVILFSYREDRLWGRTLAHQQRNIQKLYKRLSAIFPDMAFVLVGFGQHNQIKETGARIIDLRVDKFDVERDRLWMAYMSEADCAIGVHGSNMLLPSGLAKSTVELVPRSRLGNIFQDILFPHHLSDLRDAFLKYRFIYGKNNLSDIKSLTVAEVIFSILAYGERNSFWFKVDEHKAKAFSTSKPLVHKAASQYLLAPPASLSTKLKLKLKEFFSMKQY